MTIPETVRFAIAGCVRELPVSEVAPGVHIGILTLFGDALLTEAAGCELARLVPDDVEVIVMPDGKAQTLAHVVQRELYMLRRTHVPTILARKEPKSYMEAPVLETPAVSITTQKKHAFFLGDESVRQIRGRKVLILDDVVSSGGTIKAVQVLLELAGARETVVMAVGTEGERRNDVIALAHFQVYFSWSSEPSDVCRRAFHLRRFHFSSNAPKQIKRLMHHFRKCATLNDPRQPLVLHRKECCHVVPKHDRAMKCHFARKEFCFSEFAHVRLRQVFFNLTFLHAQAAETHPGLNAPSRKVEFFPENFLQVFCRDNLVHHFFFRSQRLMKDVRHPFAFVHANARRARFFRV